MSTTEITDYVVVGAGTAGSVVARRLLDAGFDVTVLEAGPADDRAEITDPFGAMALFGSEVDWGFATVPQMHANDRVLYQPRGKTLGGSTVLNGMVYVRGAAADYDSWESAGASGWGWADVEPFFRRLEQYDGPPDSRRGTEGPLRIHANAEPSPLVRDILSAAVEAGHRENPDYNAGDSTGASLIQATLAEGHRVTAWNAYGEQVAGSPRLHVRTGATVRTIIVEGGRAVGVRVDGDAGPGEIRVRGEVILAAGTFGTPHLLMLSGIGPRDELARHGIDVVADLPGVGRNLRDHVGVPVVWSASEVSPPTTTGIEVQVISTGTDDALVRPDWQTVFLVFPFSPVSDGLPQAGFTGLAILLHPHSAGSVTLASPHPDDPPVIDPAILSDPRDVESLVDQVETVRTIGRQPALARWVEAEAQPGSSVTSREEIRKFVARAADSGHHQVGTARIGIDELAVVDPTLRVHGLKGLRIADASVMPLPPAGNTVGAVLMIGERAADFILDEVGTARR